ncbi:MAG TPA: EAL domain-containing protein [Steroidobacteraceae bacterium]|nr:EAL domain-containing protein [Steroidobacteraceae bacterium]
MLSFRTRILGLLLALVVTIQIATMVALVVKTQGGAQSRARVELEAGGRVLTSLMQSRADQLRDAVQVLVADYGFKEAVTSGDRDTVLSALDNSAGRISADLAAFIDTSGHVLATTIPDLADDVGMDWPVRGAAVTDSGVIYRTLNDRSYLLVIAPVRAPVSVGSVAIGFRIDAALASEMRSLLGVEVSFYDGASSRSGAAMVSTLSAAQRAALAAQLPQMVRSAGQARQIRLDGVDYVLLMAPVAGSGGELFLILQTELADILRPFDDLRTAILGITVLALLLAIPIALMLARSASRPLDQLVEAAQRIEGGNYAVPVELKSSAEFSSLASTLNSMQERISEREQQIRHQAVHDDLTGLPNLAFFRDQVSATLAAARILTTSAAVLLVEIRDFDQIQASFGPSFGEEVIRETARRLASRIQDSGCLARTAEAQFMLLLPQGDEARARMLAAQIIESVRTGLLREDVHVSLNAHVAICNFPAHGDDADTLLRRLNTALYDARQAGESVLVYQPGREEGHRRQLAILGDLRRGIDGGELELHYQPKVHILTQKVQSLEALVRWNHPRHGRIPPGEFVPLAERAGSIILLTSWVLKTAHEQMRAWHAQGIDLDVSINLSAADLSDPELPELVRGRLRGAGVHANRLVLEITESAVMRETARAVRMMEELRHDGVRFSIDDFGTGYSSLAQLKRLPVDEIKIDKSFVLDLNRHTDDAVIVRSTIELGHSLGVKVVAEGVETAESWELLRQMGCDMAQGFFISAPLPGREIANWVRSLNTKLESAETPTQQVRVLKEHRRTIV